MITTNNMNNKPICCLHGWGFGSGVWSGLVASMSADWPIKTLDMPGYGALTPLHNEYDDIDAIANYLADKIPPGAVLIGWSLGGLIAIRLARQLGADVDMLILLASTPCFISKPDWLCGIAKDQVQAIADQLASNKDKAIDGFFAETALGDVSPRKTIKILKNLAVNNIPDTKVLNGGLNILGQTDLRKELALLDCRIGMVLGENDRLIVKDTGPATSLICPKMRLLMIEAAGHAPLISQQDKTASALSQLIRQAA